MFICDISQPNGKVNRFHLGKGIFQIGKGASCRIVVEDTLVSRTHAELRIDESSATIMDLNSTNGTWINQTPITKPYQLKIGDELIIGTATRLFVKEIPSKLDSMFFSIGGSGAGSQYFSEESIFDDVDIVAATRSPGGPNRRDEYDDQQHDRASDMDLDFDFSADENYDDGPRTKERRVKDDSYNTAFSDESSRNKDSGRSVSAQSSIYGNDSPFVDDAPFIQSSIYEDNFSPFAVPPPSSGTKTAKASTHIADRHQANERVQDDVYSVDRYQNTSAAPVASVANVSPAQVPEIAASQEVLTTLVNLLDQPRVQWVLVSGSEGVRLVERGGAMHSVKVFSRHVSAESVLKGLGLVTTLRKPLKHEIASGVMLSALPVGTEDWSIVIKRNIPRSRLSSFDSMVSKGMMSIEVADFLSQCVRARSNIVISSPDLSMGLELLEAAKKQAGDLAVIAAFEKESKTQGVQVGVAASHVFAQNLIEDRNNAKTVLGHLQHLGINLICVDDLLTADLTGILNFASGSKTGCIGCLESANPALGLASLAHGQGMENLGVMSMMLSSSCDLWVHINTNLDGNGYIEAVYDFAVDQDRVLQFSPIIKALVYKGELMWVGCGRVPAVVDKFTAAGIHWKPEWFKGKDSSENGE